MIAVSGTIYHESQAAMGPAACAQLEELAFRYGRCYDSYLVVEPRFAYFWARGGVVAFARHGRFVFTVGGLIAPPAARAGLLDDFLQFAAQNRLVVTIFNIPPGDLSLFAGRGLQITKFGEDAVVPLPGQAWSGAPFEWLRRQASYCRRQGLEACEVAWTGLAPEAARALQNELHAVSSAHLRMRGQAQEVSVFEGRFVASALGRRRVFVARRAAGSDGGGRVEAFLLLNPLANGREWAIEMYRHRPDAVRGATPFLMLAALGRLRDEGVARAGLCLAPAVNVASRREGDSWLLRWLLIGWGRFGSRFFNARGLYHFKSRFRPEFSASYVGVHPRINLGWIAAFLRVTGVLGGG